MKRNYIENMPEGKEIDVLVFQKIFGEHEFIPHHKNNAICSICGGSGTAYGHPKPENYSTDISAAWKVAEKLRLFVLPFGKEDWCSTNTRNFRGAFENIAVADTAPLAICRAALLVILKDLE